MRCFFLLFGLPLLQNQKMRFKYSQFFLFILTVEATLASPVSSKCDVVFVLGQLQVASPEMGFQALPTKTLSPADRVLVSEYLAKNSDLDTGNFVSLFNLIQKEHPRLSVLSTLDFLKHMKEKESSFEMLTMKIREYEQALSQVLNDHPSPQVLGKSNLGATPMGKQELAFFMFEMEQKFEQLNPSFAASFLKQALEMGATDILQVSSGLQLSLQSGLGLSEIRAVHDSIKIEAPAIGFGGKTKVASPKFLDAALMALYQKHRSMSLNELNEAAKKIVAVNPHITDPHSVAHQMLAKIEEDKDNLTVEVLDMLRKLSRKKESEEGISI